MSPFAGSPVSAVSLNDPQDATLLDVYAGGPLPPSGQGATTRVHDGVELQLELELGTDKMRNRANIPSCVFPYFLSCRVLTLEHPVLFPTMRTLSSQTALSSPKTLQLGLLDRPANPIVAFLCVLAPKLHQH